MSRVRISSPAYTKSPSFEGDFIVSGDGFPRPLRRNLRYEWAPPFGTPRCLILNSPIFLEQRDWIPAPADWQASIQVGKTYDTSEQPGAALWGQVQERLASASHVYDPKTVYNSKSATDQTGPVFGNEYLRQSRLGQGAFRAMVTEYYDRKCCITGESTLPVLEAAHIRPVAKDGDNKLVNGLLMRSDMHILYDKGLLGVTPDHKIQVSSQIREQYHNGVVYYSHHGKELCSIPKVADLQPAKEALEWHMDTVFRP